MLSYSAFLPLLRKQAFAFLEIATILLWCYLACIAFEAPVFGWDAWAYHLPFASYLWDIGGGKAGLIPVQQFQYRYAGFPLAAEWFQGALWRLCNDMLAASFINPAALALVCMAAKRWLGVPLFWLLPAMLAFPMIAIHSISLYIDVFSGGMAVTSIIACSRLFASLKDHPTDLRFRKNAACVSIFLLCATIACNSKIQVWGLLMPLLTFMVGKCLLAARRRKAHLQLVALAALLFLMCNATTLRNLYDFGNPFYPIAVASDSSQPTDAHAKERYSIDQAPDYLWRGLALRPQAFWYSVTEADWSMRHIAPHYSLDSQNTDVSPMVFRTGGLWGWYVCFQLALLGFLLPQAYRRMPQAARFCLQCFAATTLILMWMPASHELRYNLAWPMLLSLCSGLSVLVTRFRFRRLLLALPVMFLAFGQYDLPMERTLAWPDVIMPHSQVQWRKEADASIVSRLHDHQPTCIETQAMDSHLWFRYAPAVIGGTHTIVAPFDYVALCSSHKNTWLF